MEPPAAAGKGRRPTDTALHRRQSLFMKQASRRGRPRGRCLACSLTMAAFLTPTAMASGITVTANPDPVLLQSLGVTSWPLWSCGVSRFPWTYDERETCLLLEGEVSVTPAGGEPVRFGAGDLVVFEAGLTCTWEVQAPVRKHYRFG